ncbi:MAG: histidinol-phosphate transaminase [Candidatus Micrarchaeota archaeon]
MGKTVRAIVQNLSPYTWEPSSASIAAKLGLKEKDIIRFDTNTSSYNPPLGPLRKVKISEYPDASYQALARLLAKYSGVKEKQIVVGAGADEIIDVITRTFLEQGEKAVISSPTYSLFQISVELAGGVAVEVPREKDYELNAERIMSKARETDAKLIFICNPNNPTGNLTQAKDLIKIAKTVDSILVVDEAYYEFCGKSVVNSLRKQDNAIIIRTLSKGFGLAGIRVGYAIVPTRLADMMNRCRPPNSVSAISLKIAENALKNDTGDMGRKISCMQMERRRLIRELERIGLYVYPSVANFVLIRTSERLANRVCEGLLRKGIVIRNLSDNELTKGCLRITVRSRGENSSLLYELRKILSSRYDVVIFDVDGVIFDVSDSYREVIRKTASFFLGREVGMDEVERVKSIVGFNNDWDATFAIVTSAQDPTKIDKQSDLYGKVKSYFQSIYLGSQEQPGLISNEKQLISKGTLAKLRGNGLKLGIVTSRPRSEALIALGALVGTYFQKSNVIALEDCIEEKPSSKPLRILIRRMGCKRPIYVGDNPSDVVAANSAQIPIAVVGEKARGDFYLRDVNDIYEMVVGK